MDPQPALVQRADGTVIGSMTALGEDGLQVLVKTLPNFSEFQYQITTGGMPRVGGMVHVEHYDYSVDSQPQKGVPVGKLEKFAWKQSRIFPDTVRDVTVYIPQQYQPGSEACLMVWQDGSRHVDPSGSMRASVVFDNLIHKKDMPVTIGVFVDPGRKISQKQGDKAANRSLEYDSLGDAYVRFLLDEILPEVQKRYGVKFRPQPEAWAIAGGSSGGICSFTAAWERPDKFHKVLCWVGTFVDIRGGNAYPYLVRITERKHIRVYLLDGTNDLDNKFGNWPLANRMMEASLNYMGYDHRVDWTECFHGSKGMSPALPEALRWLWRDVK
jgi:enterochelin esterase family protein